MTTANLTVIETVLFKRGNTAVSSVYVGVSGEIVIDTSLQTIRVQGGNIAGGVRLATYNELSNAVIGNIDLANYATASQLTAANAIVTAQGTVITNISANLGAYQTYANANAVTQSTGISSVSANLGAYQTYANANAVTQSTGIASAQANVAAANVAIAQLLANAAAQATGINALRANITAANTAIVSLQSNAAAQAVLLATISSVTTFALLPNAESATGAYHRAMINDANLVAIGNFGQPVGSGGANTVPIYSDGLYWRVG